MKQIFILLLSGWLLLVACPSIAQEAKQKGDNLIYGDIRSKLGEPLIGASVKIDNEKTSGAIADSNGTFQIHTPRTGKVTIQVSSVGYRPQTREVYLKTGQKIYLGFSLAEDNRQLGEVTVAGASVNQHKVKQLKESGFNVNVIDVNEYGNTSSDINQVLKRTTGVLVRESGGVGSDFTFQVNGLAAKIYIDDIPMDQYGKSMTLNNIPVNLIDRIEVYKGVVPAHLGSDAMGGAVNIITKQKTRKFLDASYSFGSFNTHQVALTGGVRNKKNGLKLRASTYYNYSDNNYMMYSDSTYNVNLNVVKKDETGTFRQVSIDKARRFYDTYRSAMGEVEVGYEKVKWADWFTIGLTYSENKKQNQLGATVNSVYGGFWSENKFLMPTIKYRKDNFIIPGLYANLYANYANNKDVNRDTALYRYDWTGHWAANSGGDTIPHVYTKYFDDSYTARANFNYNLDKENNHSLNFNYTFSTTRRRIYDEAETNPEKRELSGLPNKLGKHIAGIAWQGQWLNRKLISVASFKYYGMGTKAFIDNRKFDDYGKPISGEIYSEKNFFGYSSGSLALRYRITPDWGVKGSLERGYNLPEVDAMYGDGKRILANLDLKPERSDNYNVGAYYNHFIGDHFINLDGSVFYRNSKDYIISQVVEGTNLTQSRNLPGVVLYGLEAEARYGYKDMVNLSANVSYDKAIDNWKYTDATNSQISLVYKEQLPNRPWVYGNANLMLGKRDLIGKGTRLQFNYLYQYSHWYYLTWAKLGSPGSKNFVPGQSVHSLIMAYSWKQDIYNISMEARNLTDERVYDNFRLQKPGRAFYVKLRVSLM
ncbi:TonB-dependent receptor [Chitinophaga arvensicola]|uniref:Outer membrane receptor proteins, mostly Fe transport n=1 Tax=Chitinophaga arvensicola TaxID=29529 RepID=A0A1I0RIP7_9BACT|nr:TonB-dependent receptor [Chitinophaga arvensicola]SEW40139.1 Outer membrane receptor proteins, mostly Fe transport [Chitinophaga arvensicola]